MAQRRKAHLLISSLPAVLALFTGACVLPAYDSELETTESEDAGTQCVECSDTCTDLTRDQTNCGACGVVCAAEEACVEGICTLCGELANCGYKCADLNTDPDNCSECGNACGIGACIAGSCVDNPPNPCPGSQSLCGETCSDLSTDNANCGECGNACQGTCVNGGCETGIQICAVGLSACGEGCYDLEQDPKNCGECANECTGECVGGACITGVKSCAVGLAFCDGNCTDVSSDSNNCGECANSCNGWNCVNGGCVP